MATFRQMVYIYTMLIIRFVNGIHNLGRKVKWQDYS